LTLIIYCILVERSHPMTAMTAAVIPTILIAIRAAMILTMTQAAMIRVATIQVVVIVAATILVQIKNEPP
jgi:hypothetical protein